MSRALHPSPPGQVIAALAAAKRDGVDPYEAWGLAVNGHICDSYTSARGNRPDPTPAIAGPPRLRSALSPPPPDDPDDDTPRDDLKRGKGRTLLASDARTSEQRCAGCRFVMDAGRGLARCTLYETPVFAGVVWPNDTDERQTWKNAIVGTAPEWLAAYAGEPTPVGPVIDILARALGDPEAEQLAA